MAESEKSTVDRRRLLRRAGTVAAGVAGAGVAGAVAATPAQAAPGQPVVQGELNDAGTASTTLTSNSATANPTLVLANPAQTPVGGGLAAGPALRLIPNGDWLNDEAAPGSISADVTGTPWVNVDSAWGPWSFQVQTTYNSTTTVPITPTRVVDTRNATGRQYILNQGALDSAGRLRAGQTIGVDLSHLAYFPVAVLLNATVTGQGAAGYLTVWAYDTTRPGVSSLNYSVGQNLSNFVFSSSGYDLSSVNSGLAVFSSQTTHVILDIVGFVISDGAVNPDVTPATTTASSVRSTSAAAARAKAVRDGKPKWQ
jgi:hypothetical protein